MTPKELTTVDITYDPDRITGQFAISHGSENSIWDRIQQAVILLGGEHTIAADRIELPWPALLSVLREFSQYQRPLNFRFRAQGQAKEKISEFVAQYRKVRESTVQPPQTISIDEIKQRLKRLGFVRDLKPFQLRDLQHLLSIPNGANFSVPGAGKTTVTLALHLLWRSPDQHLLVVAPKSAFPAWREVIAECMSPDASSKNSEPFTILSGSSKHIEQVLNSGVTRFVINYDLMIQVPHVISSYLSQHPVHLVLDESHRMKAGFRSQRGALLLNFASLPIRRDILTGTPMPQDISDIQAQMDFLWPGAGIGLEISRGRSPREIIGALYARTTKEELNLPKPIREFKQVEMAKGQMALYAIVRDEALRDLSRLGSSKGFDLIRAKRSVMRLLQLSANPILALRSMSGMPASLDTGIAEQVLSEGASTKMRAVADLARQLATAKRKAVIWTIFTDTIEQMQNLLADLNPVTLYGAIPSGEPTDPTTREGMIRRFHEDETCSVMIANPAAAGEGISLHQVCHDAIYLDRTYVTTHYLQSVDRIHRLGLPEGVETHIYIFQTKTPSGLGCIDHSVSRRLGEKLRALQKLLDDPDLHQIALDEEQAELPLDIGVDHQDLVDLINELEGRAPYDLETAE